MSGKEIIWESEFVPESFGVVEHLSSIRELADAPAGRRFRASKYFGLGF
jgi:hypothetical protein